MADSSGAYEGIRCTSIFCSITELSISSFTVRKVSNSLPRLMFRRRRRKTFCPSITETLLLVVVLMVVLVVVVLVLFMVLLMIVWLLFSMVLLLLLTTSVVGVIVKEDVKLFCIEDVALMLVTIEDIVVYNNDEVLILRVSIDSKLWFIELSTLLLCKDCSMVEMFPSADADALGANVAFLYKDASTPLALVIVSVTS